MPKLHKANLVTLISGFIIVIGAYQLSVECAAAQSYQPQRQETFPQQQGVTPGWQAAPGAQMCVYPNGASCPMTTATPPGTGCTCQQVWPGTGQVAAGQFEGMAQQGYSGLPGASTQHRQSFVTPPPPAGMMPTQ